MAVPDCCSDPFMKEQSTWNEGERVEIYTKCDTCGAKWKDVFTYSHATRRDDQ